MSFMSAPDTAWRSSRAPGLRPSALMFYILSPAGQATLVRHGFTPVALPSP